MTLDAFYLPTPSNASSQRFCLFHKPDAQVIWRGAVVYVHPFAEEMNKSRRMAALQARALAEAGYAVLQIDLQGCGDSSGDFGDATWEGWIEDVCLACNWLRQHSDAEIWLWGLRTGCLLASAVAARIDRPSSLLLWQPVVSGKQFLQQFLRLKLASEMQGGDPKKLMERIRRQLAQGQSVEIAGYRLSSGLADGLEKAELSPVARTARIEWIELSAKREENVDAMESMSPLASSWLEKWRAAGLHARGRMVCGPSFWQTAEIAECPALLEASTQAMMEDAPA